MLVKRPFLAYSSKYIAVPTPKIKVTGATTTISQNVPEIAPKIPALSGSTDNLLVRKLQINPTNTISNYPIN